MTTLLKIIRHEVIRCQLQDFDLLFGPLFRATEHHGSFRHHDFSHVQTIEQTFLIDIFSALFIYRTTTKLSATYSKTYVCTQREPLPNSGVVEGQLNSPPH